MQFRFVQFFFAPVWISLGMTKDRRFSRLYGGPFKVQSGPDEDPRCERRWQQLFEIVDKNGNGRVEILGAVVARRKRRQSRRPIMFSLANFQHLCFGVEP